MPSAQPDITVAVSLSNVDKISLGYLPRTA